mmetsp:Transcript_12057/g.48372  ORF Transcript_12057/g.48372 Transcript_12057/m.48372 type:complete len:265 (-) Transcript_12057:696-1490(-)
MSRTILRSSERRGPSYSLSTKFLSSLSGMSVMERTDMGSFSTSVFQYFLTDSNCLLRSSFSLISLSLAALDSLSALVFGCLVVTATSAKSASLHLCLAWLSSARALVTAPSTIETVDASLTPGESALDSAPGLPPPFRVGSSASDPTPLLTVVGESARSFAASIAAARRRLVSSSCLLKSRLTLAYSWLLLCASSSFCCASCFMEACLETRWYEWLLSRMVMKLSRRTRSSAASPLTPCATSAPALPMACCCMYREEWRRRLQI